LQLFKQQLTTFWNQSKQTQ